MAGVVKLTDGEKKYNTTHLSAWRPSSFQEWKTASPESFTDRVLSCTFGALPLLIFLYQIFRLLAYTFNLE